MSCRHDGFHVCSLWVTNATVSASQKSETLLNYNVKELLVRVVTVNETLIYLYTQQTKEGSKQWTALSEPVLKKAKIFVPAGEVLATVFQDSQSDIHIDYLICNQKIGFCQNGGYKMKLNARECFQNISNQLSRLVNVKIVQSFHFNKKDVTRCTCWISEPCAYVNQ